MQYSKSELQELWDNPTAEWRGKPFWSWNGKLKKEELFRQIHVMKEMGFGGFFMHSRTGLVTEYLGDEWFDLINACADEAERLGMEAWLYDEDRWPSGSAGGIATKDPKYRLRYLRMKQMPSEEFEWRDEYLTAFQCDLATFHGEGYQFSDGRQLSRDEDSLPAGHVALAFSVEIMDEDPFYNGSSYLDTMNPEATRKFIEVTHERYLEKCGDRIGRSIKGMFTDEPHRGMVMSSFADHEHSSWVIPWNDRLTAEFEERYGYDLMTRLPEVFLQPFSQPVSQVKWHYMELLQDLFLKNFMKPIHEWCHEHGLLLTGHLLHEDNLVSQAVPNGSVMRNYEYLDFPGVDVLTESNQKFWLAKQCQSAARQLGKPWILSELYGCTGWQLTFQEHKEIGDWQALFGINVRCHHLSWYSMRGEAKRDYPASILHQSAWYPHYGYVEDYFSRIQIFLSQGSPVCDLLVLNPIESVWAQIHHGWVNHLVASTESIQQLEHDYSDTFRWLSGTQLDFDYGDEDFLKRMGKVVQENGQTFLEIGKCRYRAVLVAGIHTIRATTLDLLEEFHKAGGAVLPSGVAPAFVDALPSTRASDFFTEVGEVPFYQNTLTRTCRKMATTFAEAIDTEFGYRIPSIYAQARDTRNGRMVMLLRVERQGWKRNVLVRLRGEGSVIEWNARTGEQYPVESKQAGVWIELRADFGPSGEHLYQIIPEQSSEAGNTTSSSHETKAIQLDREFSFRLEEPNVCVLDRAEYRIAEDEWQPANEILKVDRAVRTQLEIPLRGGRMLQPWFVGEKKAYPSTPLTLRFAFHIEEMPADGVDLAIEDPDQYQAISVNGQSLDASAGQGWWVDSCYHRLHLAPEVLKTGENSIELELDFNTTTPIETIYLLGSFGVRLDKLNQFITALPAKLKPSCVTTQGLPFYGGKIIYEIPAEAFEEFQEDHNVTLRLPGFEAACVQVRDQNENSRLIAFEPYELEISDLVRSKQPIELEVILTRRNTFGPLHQNPLHSEWYSPENWVTEGAAFSEEWNLWPAGLLASPEIHVTPSIEIGVPGRRPKT